jgi:hypothetical protein
MRSGACKCIRSFAHGKKFSPEEKMAICEEVANDNPNRTTIKDIAKYLGVNRQRICKLVHAKKNNKSFQVDGGRPPRVECIDKERLMDLVRAAKKAYKPFPRSELLVLVKELAKDADIRKGKCGINSIIDRKTTLKILSECEIEFNSGQTTSVARDREAKDIRNMLSIAAMNEAFGKDKSPQMIGNFDGTLFKVDFINMELDENNNGETKKRRRPNRPKEVIEAEKAAKKAKKEAKEASRR